MNPDGVTSLRHHITVGEESKRSSFATQMRWLQSFCGTAFGASRRDAAVASERFIDRLWQEDVSTRNKGLLYFVMVFGNASQIPVQSISTSVALFEGHRGYHWQKRGSVSDEISNLSLG
jgi:hypothetical protein